MVDENKYYRIYTKDSDGKKFYITASEGQYDRSKLILKSFKENKTDDINSLFKFKKTGKENDNGEQPGSEYYQIITPENLNWTIGIERGTSTVSYNKQKYISFPDMSQFIPNFEPDEDPEEEELEEEEEELMEEELQIENEINTSAVMTEQYVQAIQTLFGNKTYKQFHDFAQILGFEKKVTKSIKQKLAFGSVSYANKEGGPNIYIINKEHIVPDQSVLYNFSVVFNTDFSITLYCWNYESGDVNVINAEDAGEFSNIIINRHNTVKTPFFVEEAEIPILSTKIPEGFYRIKNKDGFFLTSDMQKGSEIKFGSSNNFTDNEIFEVLYYYNKMVIRTKNGHYLTFIKWKDIPKEGCFKHIKDTEVGWKRWLINTLNPFDSKYERMNFYPKGPDEPYVWCNSNKNIRDHLNAYGTPSLFLNETFEDSVLGKCSTFEILDLENNKIKLAPMYWQEYSLRKNPFGENLLIRKCDIDPFEFIPVNEKKENFVSVSENKVIKWGYFIIIVLILILILVIFIIFAKNK